MKRPLVIYVLGFLLGEVMGLYFGARYIWLIVLSCIFLFFFFFKRNILRIKEFIIAFFCILSGMLLIKCRLNGLESQVYYDKVDMNICGYVSTISEKDKSYMIRLEKCRISNDDKKAGYDNNVLLYIDKDKLDVCIGDYIEVTGKISSFERATNEGQFCEYKYYTEQMKYSYKFYEKEHRIIQRARDNPRIHRIKYYIKNILYKVRMIIKEQICKIYNEKNASIIIAMLLGEKSLMPDEIKSLYQDAGISHILAISSLHITILGMGLYKLLNRCGVNIYLSSSISLAFLILYAVMTDFSISTNRAVVMMIIMLLSKFFGRSYDIISSLCLSLLLILVKNPLLIENIAFLLSFMAMLGIIVVKPILEKSLTYDNKDISKRYKGLCIDGTTGEINDRNFIISMGDGINKLYKSIIQSLISGLSIQIFALPILINSFYEVNILSVFVNILVIPLVPILLVTAIFAILFSFFSSYIGYFLGGSSHIILELYEVVCNFIDNIRFSKVIIGYIDIYRIIIYYGVVILVVYCMYFFTKNNYQKNNLISRKIFCFIFLSWIIFVPLPNNNIKVSMLDVSQGDSICIKTKNSRTILVDGGSSDIKEVGKYRIEPFLKYNGIRKIDYVFISHMDDDHISGIINILENGSYKIEVLVLPYRQHKDEKYNKIVKLARRNKVELLEFKKGDELKINGIQFTCIHPSKEQVSESENAQSMVLKMKYMEFDMLFTGDVEGEGEQIVTELLDGKEKIEVLKVSHHGSKNSTGAEFLNRINPIYAFISAGKNNRYGHPHKETLERLEQAQVKCFSTMEYGQIDMVTNGENLLHIRNHGKGQKE